MLASAIRINDEAKWLLLSRRATNLLVARSLDLVSVLLLALLATGDAL